MTHKHTVLVFGATGAQGGSVVNALLANGHNVIGLTRNIESPAAKALAARGVELRVGDYSQPDTLRAVAKGADAAFFMTTPFETGPESEVTQGVSTIDALRDANVNHVVFSSVGDADKATGISHFDSKYKVEEYLVESGLNYSIVAPVYFMENLNSPWTLPELQKGNVAAAMSADRILQQVAVQNIGEFAVALIERGETVFGKRYDIAGDELSFVDAVNQASKASGRDITFQSFPIETLKSQNEELAVMFEWFDTTGYSANIASLKSEFPEVNWLSFADWLELQDWSVLDAA